MAQTHRTCPEFKPVHVVRRYSLESALCSLVAGGLILSIWFTDFHPIAKAGRYAHPSRLHAGGARIIVRIKDAPVRQN